MKSSSLLSLALGVSWIFSPEALVIAGNVSGQMGWLIFPSLIGVVIVYMVCSRLLRSESLPSSPGWDFLVLQRGSGSIPATTLSLTACLPLTILAGTALLVTAGYTFNEVFLYWFPNFGFSFLLLGLLTTLQLFRKEYALWLQLCFSTLAMGGLLLLALYGIFSPDKQSTELLQQGSGFSLSSVSLLLLIFVGHTLSVDQRRSSFPLPLVMGFLLSGLWILASLGHVSPERLAASTIPYKAISRETTLRATKNNQLIFIFLLNHSC